MVLNVSGRTDIVAFYSDWFFKRLEAGFVDVRNPFNPKLVSRINFSDVDLIMFCTKNPIPLVSRMDEIKMPFIVHVTLTPYGSDIEPNLPKKTDVIEAIKKIAEKIGKKRVFVRYDPIFISDKYDVNYHVKMFTRMCQLLDGYVESIIVSFLDEYKNVLKNKSILRYQTLNESDYELIGKSFSEIAKSHGMSVQTCFEEHDLCEYGFIKGECLSHELAYFLTGKKYKDWTARKDGKCGCVQMVDIGVYNSCKHFCKYCYANYDEALVQANFQKHNVNSSLLVGELGPDDVIKVRKK